jgi:alkylhydroperoxidase family enzyme
VIHTPALEALGVPAEVIDTLAMDVNPAKLLPVQRVVVELAAKTATKPKSISDEDLKSLRGDGLSNGEIIEVAMIASFANFLNAWAEVSGILTDEEASA